MEKNKISVKELLSDAKKFGKRIVRLIPENGQDLNRWHPFVRELMDLGIIWYPKGHDIEMKSDYEIDLRKYIINYVD